MSERSKTLERAFLFTGLEVNGQQVYPLSANRRTFLSAMGNPLFGGDKTDMNEELAITEALHACTKKPSQLGEYMTDSNLWMHETLAFAVSLEDFTQEKFQNMLLEEITAQQAGEIESLGKDQAQPQSHV
jgi:hypothetical protein